MSAAKFGQHVDDQESEEEHRGQGGRHVASAIGFGQAAELAVRALSDGEGWCLRQLRDRFEHGLAVLLPGRVHLNGHPTERLPNTANIRIDGVPALRLLERLSDVVLSAGSACHAGRDEPSSVLIAMGLTNSEALSALRVSLGRWTTPVLHYRHHRAQLTLSGSAAPGP